MEIDEIKNKLKEIKDRYNTDKNPELLQKDGLISSFFMKKGKDALENATGVKIPGIENSDGIVGDYLAEKGASALGMDEKDDLDDENKEMIHEDLWNATKHKRGKSGKFVKKNSKGQTISDDTFVERQHPRGKGGQFISKPDLKKMKEIDNDFAYCKIIIRKGIDKEDRDYMEDMIRGMRDALPEDSKYEVKEVKNRHWVISGVEEV